MSESLASQVERIERHARTLRSPFRNVDDKDWAWIMDWLGDGAHGKFWKDVLTEMRGALELAKPYPPAKKE